MPSSHLRLIQTMLGLICFIGGTTSACRQEAIDPSNANGQLSCFGHGQEFKLSKRLQRAATQFTNASQEQRLRMHHRYQESLDNQLLPSKKSLKQLARYFSDITDSSKEPLSGAYLQVMNSNKANKVIELEIGALDTRSVNETVTPFWSGYAIPESVYVRDYPLYRGEQSLIEELGSSLEPLNEKILVNIERLFTSGMSLKKLEGDRYFYRPDAFLHSLDSSQSELLSSSTNFDVARRFGIKAGSKWSAVIEFRGYGVDINKADYYFSQFEFLKTGSSMHSSEFEVAINQTVQPSQIRGVWLINGRDEKILIKNPNYKF